MPRARARARFVRNADVDADADADADQSVSGHASDSCDSLCPRLIWFLMIRSFCFPLFSPSWKTNPHTSKSARSGGRPAVSRDFSACHLLCAARNGMRAETGRQGFSLGLAGLAGLPCGQIGRGVFSGVCCFFRAGRAVGVRPGAGQGQAACRRGTVLGTGWSLLTFS